MTACHFKKLDALHVVYSRDMDSHLKMILDHSRNIHKTDFFFSQRLYELLVSP